MTSILLVPGYQNSGPGHWQTLWEGVKRDARRVQMPNWEFPRKAEWVLALDEAIDLCEEPPVLVGHSLGCIAIAHWAATWGARPVQAALLVAPTDIERVEGLEALKEFAPIPRLGLPFPSILAASSEDPFMGVDRARDLARAWGSRFVDLGPCGHVNVASGHGEWPRGEALLQELM